MRTFFMTFGLAYACIVSVVLATGCTPLQVKSTAAILGPTASATRLELARDDAAILAVGSLEALGFVFLEQHETRDTLVVRLLRSRVGEPVHWQAPFGTALYLMISPTGPRASSVTLVARPRYQGQELCTIDFVLPVPCREIYSDHHQDLVFAARADAELVRGVLAELRRSASMGGDAASLERLAERDHCRRTRQERMDRVLAHRDLRTRAKAYNALLKGYPEC